MGGNEVPEGEQVAISDIPFLNETSSDCTYERYGNRHCDIVPLRVLREADGNREAAEKTAVMLHL